MISLSHSPNSNIAQQLKSLSFLLFPWKWPQWLKGSGIQRLEADFTQYQGAKEAIAFSKGREALLALLKAMEIGEGDEVIVQAYTCIVIPNAILYAGAKPIYVDVDNTLNIDPKLIEQKICSKTKAIIIQHNFGIPAEIASIKALSEKYGLFLIEDCAHSLGARYDNKPVGSFGDAAMFSFGRDKIISSISGGIATTQDPVIGNKLRQIQQQAPARSRLWVFQCLMHPLTISWMSRLIDNFKLGQFLIQASQFLKITNKVYSANEKKSVKDSRLIYKMPNALADLAQQQLKGLDQKFIHRREIAKKYRKFCEKQNIDHQKHLPNTDPANLRFTILIENASDFQKYARSQGFLLGDWYNNVIVPQPSDWKDVCYKTESCPQAEKYTRVSINLPTHWKMTQKRVARLIKIMEHYL